MGQAVRKQYEDEAVSSGDTSDDAQRSRHAEEVFELCDRMIDIAAALFGVSGRELREPGRARNPAARVRQIAMYVTHVTFGITMTDVGTAFGRDRSTVMHACHMIEDMRDDDEFDRIIVMMERIATAALENRIYR